MWCATPRRSNTGFILTGCFSLVIYDGKPLKERGNCESGFLGVAHHMYTIKTYFLNCSSNAMQQCITSESHCLSATSTRGCNVRCFSLVVKFYSHFYLAANYN